MGKNMKAIVLYLKLVRRIKGIPLTYMIRQNVKVVHISSWYDAYFDKEMIARAHKVNKRMNLQINQDCLSKKYVKYQCNISRLTMPLQIIFSQGSLWKWMNMYV